LLYWPELGLLTPEQQLLIGISQDTDWTVWTQANGIFAKATNVNQLPNSRYESGGIFVGADYEWAEQVTTGLFGGYQGV
jgi:uncharacterized protein with beta-barrel porin domain